MHNEKKIAVAIPCYRVEEHLGRVVEDIPDFVDYILLVDDCSPASTPALIDRMADGRRIVEVLIEKADKNAAR